MHSDNDSNVRKLAGLYSAWHVNTFLDKNFGHIFLSNNTSDKIVKGYKGLVKGELAELSRSIVKAKRKSRFPLEDQHVADLINIYQA